MSCTMLLVGVITFAAFATGSCDKLDGYYWREYLGTVPKDAIVAGLDANGNDVFLGQIYLRSAGIIVGRIEPSVKYLHVPYATFVIVGKYAKVLCGNPEHFYWMPSNATTFHAKIASKNPVIGGHDDRINDYLNIGRVKVGADIRVGKIDPSKPKAGAPLYYADDEMERRVDGYFEVLMYGKDHEKDG